MKINLELNKTEIFLLLLSLIMLVLMSYGFYFLVWFALAPLIYLAFIKSVKKTLILSILYGVSTSAIFFTWVYDANLEYRNVLYLIIIFTFTIYFILFLTIISLLSKKLSYAFLLPPTIWIILMMLYSLLPMQIYWMDFAIFQPNMAPLIWYIGSYGITFLIILFNSIIAYYFVKKNKMLPFLSSFLVLIILGCTLYSTYSDFQYNEDKIKVALLQGNFPYSWEWRQENAFGIVLDAYLNMTYKASKENPNIVLWPEYSLAEDIVNNKNIFNKLKATAKSLNTTLIIGYAAYVDNEKYKDTAFVVKPDGSYETYDAVSPVFLEQEVVKGTINKQVSYNGKKFGITICNEENIQSITRGYSAKDAKFIVSMSNNQFFGRGRHIISQFTRLRAAENAKYIIRATNDGVTQIVNPFGKVVYSAEPKKQKILIGDIYVNEYKTFYTKYGNILVYLILLLSIILMLKKR